MSPRRVDDTTSPLFFVFSCFCFPPGPPRGTLSPTPPRQTFRGEPPLGKRSDKNRDIFNLVLFSFASQARPVRARGRRACLHLHGDATRLSFALPRPPCPVARGVSCVAIHEGARSVACEKVPSASAFIMVNFSKVFFGCLHLRRFTGFFDPSKLRRILVQYPCKKYIFVNFQSGNIYFGINLTKSQFGIIMGDPFIHREDR